MFNAKHTPGEFVVKFFGTYDHFWVNRGRSFLFQEGDTIDTGSNMKNKVETIFKKAVEEAVVAHKMKKREFLLYIQFGIGSYKGVKGLHNTFFLNPT